MTKTDLENFDLINGFVQKYFSLNTASKESFQELILNPDKRAKYISPEFLNIIGEDHRFSFSLSGDDKIDFDDGWKMFKEIFHEFVMQFAITYENYISNKIRVNNNQEIKLFKFMRNWYSTEGIDYQNKVKSKTFDKNICPYGSDFELAFKRATERIGTSKLPDRDLTVTASFNFADWFMVSTSENWSSCLNVQSDYEACFWTGLPGLIVDPNRILLYITDGKTKSYRGITVKKFINRTWGLLNTTGEIVPVRHYPQKFVDDESFAELFPFDVSGDDIENVEFRSKYPIDNFLFNNFGESIYIYQDFTEFEKTDDGIFIISGSSGYHKMTEGGYLDEDTNYDYCDGLDGLIDSNIEISNYEDAGVMCAQCGERYNEDDMLWGADDQQYCESCYSDNFCNCYHCGESMHNEDAHFDSSGDAWCENHFFDRFFYCEECGEVYALDEVHHHNNEMICTMCYEDRFTTCEECECEIDIDDVVYIDNRPFCKSCSEEEKSKGVA